MWSIVDRRFRKPDWNLLKQLFVSIHQRSRFDTIRSITLRSVFVRAIGRYDMASKDGLSAFSNGVMMAFFQSGGSRPWDQAVL